MSALSYQSFQGASRPPAVSPVPQQHSSAPAIIELNPVVPHAEVKDPIAVLYGSTFITRRTRRRKLKEVDQFLHAARMDTVDYVFDLVFAKHYPEITRKPPAPSWLDAVDGYLNRDIIRRSTKVSLTELARAVAGFEESVPPPDAPPEGSISKRTSRNLVSCPVCGRKSHSQRDLTAHFMSVHVMRGSREVPMVLKILEAVHRFSKKLQDSDLQVFINAMRDHYSMYGERRIRKAQSDYQKRTERKRKRRPPGETKARPLIDSLFFETEFKWHLEALAQIGLPPPPASQIGSTVEEVDANRPQEEGKGL